MLGWELIGNSWCQALGKGVILEFSSLVEEKCIYKVLLGLWLHVVFDPRYCCDSTHWSCRDKEAEGRHLCCLLSQDTQPSPDSALSNDGLILLISMEVFLTRT